MDIERLYAFLYEKNPEAAARAAQGILDGSRYLEKMPDMGRPMQDDTGRREYFIPFGAAAYILRYRRDQDAVIILRVWHSRENRAN